MGDLRRAVFLDRDGVILEDRGACWRPDDARIYPYAPDALARLRRAGFALVVVTNQPVVARGLATLDDVAALHAWLNAALAPRGARIDHFECCPHHPEATLPAWRVDCACRKPRPGMILRAARALGLDLAASELIGDRRTDIAAGLAAGCTTTLVTTGAHDAPRIVTPEPDRDAPPHRVAPTLVEAVDAILGARA